MASSNPGIGPLAAVPAEDPMEGAFVEGKDGTLIEEERPVAPDQFDERYETSRWEIW